MNFEKTWSAIMQSFGYNSLQEVFETPPRSTMDTLYREIAITGFLDKLPNDRLADLLEKYVWADMPNGPRQVLISEAIDRLRGDG